MGLVKMVLELSKKVPACKPVANTLKEITDSLKKNFHGAQPQDIKAQFLRKQKDVQRTASEMDKSVPKRRLDINDGQPDKLSFDPLINEGGKLKEPRTVKPSYDPGPSTKINRYGQDKGYGNSGFGNILGPKL